MFEKGLTTNNFTMMFRQIYQRGHRVGVDTNRIASLSDKTSTRVYSVPTEPEAIPVLELVLIVHGVPLPLTEKWAWFRFSGFTSPLGKLMI